ncbi:hypothetical protein MTR67_007601 [Solanum verrucosum]|uniref:Reverse transcriptase domain-containing protein n=1 Tax=Solanum verrucosum TaxID=315347 RepID=A0AAF0Q5D8_SOLVR|nr:hypothetical protein MTR67_007601 [Solanum verrucosum]
MENVLLAQEIIRDIYLRNKHINVVVKLDMAKAYDRVSWIFLTKVLRKLGFAEVIIDMIWRLVSNNWYSVLINGRSHGFFRSTRGLKPGDPLSPTLFIIGAEVLARGLNKLHGDEEFKGFGLPKWSPQINHLSYVDDTILFCSGDRRTLIKMMRVLRDYENTSGQMINKAKSFFYLHDKTPLIVAIRLRRLTGIKIEGLHLQQLIIKWWEHKSSNKLEQVLKAVPIVLMWELWKRRNARRHGNEYSYNWMIHQCQMTIHQIIRAKFLWIKEAKVLMVSASETVLRATLNRSTRQRSDYQHGCRIDGHLEDFTILFKSRISTSESGNRLSYFEKPIGKKLENSMGISGEKGQMPSQALAIFPTTHLTFARILLPPEPFLLY